MGKKNAMWEVYPAGNMQSTKYECGIWVPLAKRWCSEEESAQTAATATLLGIL